MDQDCTVFAKDPQRSRQERRDRVAAGLDRGVPVAIHQEGEVLRVALGVGVLDQAILRPLPWKLRHHLGEFHVELEFGRNASNTVRGSGGGTYSQVYGPGSRCPLDSRQV